jgi:hypothetical protein
MERVNRGLRDNETDDVSEDGKRVYKNYTYYGSVFGLQTEPLNTKIYKYCNVKFTCLRYVWYAENDEKIILEYNFFFRLFVSCHFHLPNINNNFK